MLIWPETLFSKKKAACPIASLHLGFHVIALTMIEHLTW